MVALENLVLGMVGLHAKVNQKAISVLSINHQQRKELGQLV
jgi:hypothetical protein